MKNLKTKMYNQAPLPFQGQKRNFIKYLNQVVKDFDDTTIFVDLFGGSGLLSHNIKQLMPQARVIYNDFDNYSQRLKNIDKTNKLLSEIREILKDEPRSLRVSEKSKNKILELIKEQDKKGFVDWITISASICFAMKYVVSFEELKKQTLYNRIKMSDYNCDGYLQGVEIVSMDYKDLYDKYKDIENVTFLVDPPYLSTDCSTYNNAYWKLKDFLDVLKVLDSNFLYFTSNKSSVIELCHWIGDNISIGNPFQGAKSIKIKTSAGINNKYTDMMYYKRKCK